MGLSGGRELLADRLEHLLVPVLVDVERLAALDPVERDRAEHVTVLLILADHARLTAQRTVDGEVGALLDQREVGVVRRSRAGEVAGLLDHDLLGLELLGELRAEPGARVDLIETHVAEGVAGDLFTVCLHLGDDGVETGALREEDGHVADLVHDLVEALGLLGDVDDALGNVDAVDVPGLLREADLRQPLLVLDPLAVLLRRGGGQPSAVAAHDLVHDQHARTRVVLRHDVLGEDRALLGRGPGAERLTDRDHVIVDRLGKADDGQPVVVLGKVGGQVGGGRVGVVATDGVQDVDAVLDEAVGRDLERVVALGHQAALDEVLCVGQLDARVTDGRAAELLEERGVGAHGVVDDEEVALQQALVPVAVGNDLDFRGDSGVALNEPTDRGGKAGGEAAGREDGYLLNHECPFVKLRNADARRLQPIAR